MRNSRRSWTDTKITRTLLLFIAALMVLASLAPAGFGQASVQGTWQTLSQTMPINPVHAALMHNGKILVVSGSGNLPSQTTFFSGVWDPSNNSFSQFTQSWDMFCNGMVVLPDGRPFVMGGNLQYDPFHGWQRTAAFDPATGVFTDMEDMAHGRWYPTSTVLGDGRVVTFSGLTETGGTNVQTEIYKVGVGWATAVSANWTPDLYPRLLLLPNSGKVMYAGSNTQSRTFDPSNSSWTNVATTNYSGVRTYGSAVMLPLTPANSYKPKVMIFGGGNPSTNTTETIDMSLGSPAWVNGPNMVQPRIEMNATLLPDGKVLTVGGSLNDEDTGSASLQADLYNSNTGVMGSAGSNAFARLYHSVAVLLPDATVWVAGGNPSRGSYENHVEIYTPPYLYNSNGTLATRPSISSISPSIVGYGTAFQVNTPDAANISSVVLIRATAVTHAFNYDQRMVGLNFSAGSGVLNVTGPPNGNTAPPGYYMLFILNNSGVPSVAKWVQVSSTPTDVPPTGTITSPATDVTIAPGQSVTFAGTGTAQSGSITGYSWVFRGGSPGKSGLANPGAVTFSTAGTYKAILTVTDTAGNTDQSPPTRTITVASVPAPTLSNANPNSAAQGATNVSVVLTGTNFLNSPTCNFGSGITVNSCTFNSSTKITASITVGGSATVGTRNIIVTNTDGQSATLTNGFSVTQGSGTAPTLTSASPNSGTQGQSNLSVVLTGTNFLTGPTCNFGAGITINSCTFNSSTKVTAVISISASATVGSRNIIVTDTDGQSATLTNGFTVNSSGGGGISLGGGFTAGSMVLNGNASIGGNALTITPNLQQQVGSAWFATPQNIQSFTTDFTFQLTAGASTADGFAFVLQNNNTAALGTAGGNLGYTGVGKSVAVKFDLYSNNGEGVDSTGIFTNGAVPYTPAFDMSGAGVDIHSGHVFKVHMTYDGANLAMTVTDNTTNAAYSKTFAVDIPTTVGGTAAFAGFSGGTGGLSALHKILTWTMTPGSGGGGIVAAPTFTPPAGTYLGAQNVTISDATSGSTIFYTLDGTNPGTSAGGSTIQYTGQIPVSSNTTIKALATAPGMTTSGIVTAAYVIQTQVAQPTFSPGGGNYPTAQNVTISTTTSGATIYYTTNGSTPTTSSNLYGGPVNVAVSETLKAIAVKSGFFDSNVGSATYTIGSGGGGISLGGGFTAGSMVLNGNASIGGNALTITPNLQQQVGSAWFATPQNIQNFTTDFTFQLTAGASTADGFAFVLQNNNTAALGTAGGNLGYTGVGKSVAVKFDLYSNNGEGVDSTGIFTNGAVPYTPAFDMSGAGVDIHSGHVFKVHMTYDGANLAMTVTDNTTNAVYSKSFAVDIPTTVGGATAYAGFSGGTGGLTAAHKILTWTMSPGNGGGGTQVATPTFSIPGGTYLGAQTVSITDATPNSTIFYTLDGTQPGTAAGGSTIQYTGAISVTSTKTITALATASGLTTSATTAATYTIQSQVATPTFSPGAGNYPTAQNVTISTTTSGATIYYTTNGSTPTTSSNLYGGTVNVAVSETLKAIAVKSGFFDSNVGTAAYTIGSGTLAVNYASGFTPGNLTFNGNAVLNGSRLQVTNINTDYADGTAWYNTPVNIQKFTTDFTFQQTQTQPSADGMAFVIQNNDTAQISDAGGGLGYGPDTLTDPPGIPKSVAIKFDLFDNNGEGTNSTGLYTNGASPTTPATTLAGGVDLHSGDIFSVHIVYDGTTLTMTITDTTNTAKTFTKAWTVNIPTTVGGNTAYVGFTGGTGGLTATQEVLTWTYTVN